MERVSFDEFDWSTPDQTPLDQAVPASPEPAPPPPPAPREQRRSRPEPYPALLPPSYREYKRPERRPVTPTRAKTSFDDFDWTEGEAQPVESSRYNPDDDWALWRGVKAGFEGGGDAISAGADMARIAMLPADQQVAAMLEQPAADPYATKLQVEGLQDIGGVGDVFTYVGESIGQMLGSWGAAATYGGGAGAATGAAGGAAVGALGAGAGAIPGAVAGGVGGFTYGTYAGFGAMGVGGMWRDLLADEGVRQGLQDGTVNPQDVFKYAVGGGALIGFLDAIPAARRVSEAAGTKEIAKDAVKKQLKSAIVSGLVKGGVEEGGTEGLQGAISELGQGILGGDANIGERTLSVINQMVAGAIGGGAAGALSGSIENSRIPETAAPAVPPGTTAPVPPVGGGGGTGGPGDGGGDTPPAPVGVTPTGGAKPPAGRKPVMLEEGGVDPDIASTTDEEFAEEEEGEFGEAPVLPADPYAKPVAAPEVAAPPKARRKPTIDPDVAAAADAIAPAPAVKQQPKAPAAPAVPAAELYRTGVSAYGEPGAPSPEISPTEGLPDYGEHTPLLTEEEEPEAAPVPLAPPPEPELPLKPIPEPAEVEVVPPGLEGQLAGQAVSRETEAAEAVVPETKAERAKRVARERAEAKRLDLIRSYAESLQLTERVGKYGEIETVRASDLADAVAKYSRLDENDRQVFLEAMAPEVRAAVEARLARVRPVVTPQITPQRPAREPPAREKAPAGTSEPPKPRARPRAVLLPSQAKIKAEATPTTRVPVRITPSYYRGLTQKKLAQPEEAKPRAEGVPQPLEPMPEKEFLKTARKMEGLKGKSLKQLRALYQDTDTYRRVHAAWKPVAKPEVSVTLAAPSEVDKLLKRVTDAAGKARVLKPGTNRTVGYFRRVEDDGSVRLSTGRRISSVEALFSDYDIELPETTERAGFAEGVTSETERESVHRRMTAHFLKKSAKPIDLKSAGFSDKEIAALVQAGMAEYDQKQEFRPGDTSASMDREEFKRWNRTQRGAKAEPSGREPSPYRPEHRMGKQAAEIKYYPPRPLKPGEVITMPTRVVGGKLVDVATPAAQAEAHEAMERVGIELRGKLQDVRIAEQEREEKAGIAGLKKGYRRKVLRPSPEATPAARRAAGTWLTRKRKMQSHLEEALGVELPARLGAVTGARAGASQDEVLDALARIEKARWRPAELPEGITAAVAKDALAQARKEFKRRRWQPTSVMWVKDASGELVQVPTKEAVGKARYQTLTQGELQVMLDEALSQAEKAVAKFEEEQNEINAKAADEAHILAYELWAQDIVQRKSAKTGIKLASAIANEDWNTTRRAALDELNLFNKGQVAGRDKHLLKIGRLWKEYLSFGKKAIFKEARERLFEVDDDGKLVGGQIYDVQQQRIAAARKEDARRATAQDKMDEATKRERKRLDEQEKRLIAIGVIEPGALATESEKRTAELGRYTKRLRRAVKSGPKLRRVVAETKLPRVDESKLAAYRPPATERERQARLRKRVRGSFTIEKLRELTAKQARVLRQRGLNPDYKAGVYRSIADWARNFVAEAKKAAHNAGATLPVKIDERFNTLEENVIAFVRDMMTKRAERKELRAVEQAGGRLREGEEVAGVDIEGREGKGIEAREKGEGRAPVEVPSGGQYPRGYNLMEAYTVVYLLKRGGPDDARTIMDMIFDRQRTAAVSTRGQGMTQKESQKVYQQQGVSEVAEFGDVTAPEPEAEFDVVRGEEAVETEAAERMGETTEQMANRLRKAWGLDEDYMAAPAGWGGSARLEPDDISEIEEIIRQVAGLDKVTWVERLKVGQYIPAWGKVVEEAAGQYRATDDAITLVRALANKGIAYHEAFHRLQRLFLNDKQRAVLTAELPRLRKIVSQLASYEGVDISGRSQNEIEAEAFRAIAAGLVKAPGRVGMVWAKLKQLVRRIHNYMQGRGFQTAEDIFRAAAEGKIRQQVRRHAPVDDQTAYMAAPFSTTALGNFVKGNWGRTVEKNVSRSKLWLKAIDNETMRRRVGEQFFGGNFDNPFSRWLDAHMSHERRVENAMREADRKDEEIRRWEAEDPARTAPMVDAYRSLLEGSLDGVDPRKPIAATADAADKAAHARLKTIWDAAPAEIRTLLSDRADIMKKQMELHEEGFARQWLQSRIDSGMKLPPFLTFDGAIKQLMAGKLSPGFEKELGRNAQTLKDARELGKYTRKGGLYMPAFRAGSHFISARLKIATPDAPHGRVVFDKKIHDERGIFRWEFTDKRDADAYREKMASTGEQRVLKTQVKYVDPKTGLFLPGRQKVVRDASGTRKGEPRYYVVMQDRFMAMSDSIAELEAQRDEMRASGDYEHVTDVRELAEHLEAGAAPLALQKMLNNIDSMTGMDADQKRVSKQIITNTFIQTQQGNRLSKKLLKRTGVHGYTTASADMYRSFNSHNEMMSRNIVALDRIPELREAKAEVMKYRDALADPTKRKDLTPEQLARVTADYAKHGGQAALRLGNYIAELNHRVENSMKPRKPGRGTDLMHMLSSLTTMTYLATPSYYAIQMLGFIQTFQRMSAKYGVGRAYRNMLRAYGDLQSGKLMGKGALEGWREIQGLPDVARTGLFRRPHDFVEDAIDKLRASGTRNLDLKIRALRHAHLLGHLGQAGLDQPNLRLRNIEAGVLNKGLKGIESFTRIFRALQEGIETVNRAAPISAYVDILVENGGLSDTEIVNRAVTNMVNEQTSYAKGNWASWMNHPLAEFPMMFKKFALTQAIVFYESLAKSVAPSSSPAERSAAITHLVMVTATLAAIGGLSGNPLWEPARLGLYLLYLFGVLEAETWDETKTKGEQALAAIVGQPTAEAMMYGLPRLAGIDISSRVASDNLFTFQQPEEFTQDNIYQLIGSIAAGAPGSVILNGGSVFANVATGEYGKAFQQLPLPKTAKDIVKAYDQSVNGIRTTTGVNTGAALNIGEALATAAGFRTRTHVRPFEQGSVAQKKAKDRIKSRRQVIITDAVNNGMNAATMREVAEWNRVHPAKEERITVKTLIAARKRRRDIEKEIREANKE